MHIKAGNFFVFVDTSFFLFFLSAERWVMATKQDGRRSSLFQSCSHWQWLCFGLMRWNQHSFLQGGLKPRMDWPELMLGCKQMQKQARSWCWQRVGIGAREELVEKMTSIGWLGVVIDTNQNFNDHCRGLGVVAVVPTFSCCAQSIWECCFEKLEKVALWFLSTPNENRT